MPDCGKSLYDRAMIHQIRTRAFLLLSLLTLAACALILVGAHAFASSEGQAVNIAQFGLVALALGLVLGLTFNCHAIRD